MPYPDQNDQNRWCDHVMCSLQMQMQNIESVADKIKIEQTKMKNIYFVMKESCKIKSFSVFYKFQVDNKWPECRELLRKFEKCFFSIFFLVWVKLKASSRGVSILFWLSLWLFSRHGRLDDCVYGALLNAIQICLGGIQITNQTSSKPKTTSM